ncbi:MAG TPA: LptE family protein [Candidatus Acidoferrales bacterium]|jgi:outer membrane lipopolysaccharide assembly protein LptE/RlpB|nr:LptE family protein [Candidatus Acidoferrales bacterium]
MQSPRRRLTQAIPAIFLAATLAGCGYHVGGRGTALPANLHTIAIPAFVNKTPRYRIEQRLTEAVTREFLARTSYRTVPDPSAGDAVLHGEVTGLESAVAVFDTATGRATAMLVTVRMKVSLVDQTTKQEIYKDDNFLFRQPYAISVDVNSFFDEQNPALDRMSRDFASKLVAAIVEKF